MVRVLLAVSLSVFSTFTIVAADPSDRQPQLNHRTFAVSQVEKAIIPLVAEPANQVLHAVTGDTFEAAPDVPDSDWLIAVSDHPFVVAAHLAFAEHRSLALSPDMIWLLINHMAAREMLGNPERYRAIFAAHQEGQRTLIANRDTFVLGSPANDWPGVFAEFEKTVIDQAPDPLLKLFSHPFSTSTPDEITARRATLLKAASPYFKYQVETRCGIPEISLDGTVEDWRWIRDHLLEFGKLGMEKRVTALTPILDQFVAAADGHINQQFWRNFYKYNDESGGSYVTGWINLFFINEQDREVAETIAWDTSFQAKGANGDNSKQVIENIPIARGEQEYPSGYVEQVFLWKYRGEPRPMLFRAGFLGISQDKKDLTLRPQISWQIIRMTESVDQRNLRRFLGGIHDYLGFAGINQAIAFDPIRKECRCAETWTDKERRAAILPPDGWLRVIPMLTGLPSLLIEDIYHPWDKRAEGYRRELLSNTEFYRSLLALPLLKEIHYPADIDVKCLAILADRKDWVLIPNR